MKEKMPKVGQRVTTRMGEATVVGNNPLKKGDGGLDASEVPWRCLPGFDEPGRTA
jgi:hypothetical protein